MRPDHASLCFLSFRRPQLIFDGIRSAVENAGAPCEVIVHDDGSDRETQRRLHDALAEGNTVSRLILTPPGRNEGVGASIGRCFAVATGDPVIKLDQDLLFEPGWLAEVNRILADDPTIGMLGLFKYWHEPVDWRNLVEEDRPDRGYHVTRQFCGSGFAIPRGVLDELGPLETHSAAFAEDVDFMNRCRAAGLRLALPSRDLVTNRGFGIGPDRSTVVTQTGQVQGIHGSPRILNADSGPGRQASQGHAPLEAPERPQRRYGVVVTAAAGREENLRRLFARLAALENVAPERAVVVFDGCDPVDLSAPFPIDRVRIPKHRPGAEQPRNVGAHRLPPEITHVWFLDSDLVFGPDCLAEIDETYDASDTGDDCVVICPYDWMPPGQTEPDPALRNDPRWASFDEFGFGSGNRVNDLGAALACFGGNLVWPLDRFKLVGGFHPGLHHGRCEDGELGLRAASHGVPMRLAPLARAWHVWHPVDHEGILRKNERDVPLLNKLHPWTEERGLVMRQEDGARFNFICPTCQAEVNSLEYWRHMETHQ